MDYQTYITQTLKNATRLSVIGVSLHLHKKARNRDSEERNFFVRVRTNTLRRRRGGKEVKEEEIKIWKRGNRNKELESIERGEKTGGEMNATIEAVEKMNASETAKRPNPKFDIC